MTMFLGNKKFTRFILLFFTVFLLAYYGLQFITGLGVAGGYYSPLVEKYFNIGAWVRTALIYSTKYLLLVFNLETYRSSEYALKVVDGRGGVRIVYGCLGFAVMSFWVAYVIATEAKTTKKLKWFFGGLALLWFINTLRISLVLLATNKGWTFPFGWNHHTWFNIVAYLAIFAMMYFFEKTIKKSNAIES